jgi:hypothetical protein
MMIHQQKLFQHNGLSWSMQHREWFHRDSVFDLGICLFDAQGKWRQDVSKDGVERRKGVRKLKSAPLLPSSHTRPSIESSEL